MPRAGRRRKKRRTEKEVDPSEKEKKETPRCFVLKRGNVGQRVKQLVQDLRMVMMPNTAKSLRESKMNRVEDFVAVASHYGVSHLIMFSSTKVGTYMKLTKLPQGPTLTFKVLSFSLQHAIRAMQKRPRSGARDYASAPLQVLNGFGSGGGNDPKKASERQVVAEMLRGLFPSMDVRTFNQADCRRVALFQNDAEKDCIQFRHYSVSRRQTGLNRAVSALLNTSRLPKLGGKGDLADFVLGTGGTGNVDSDGEDVEETMDSAGGGKVAVRLTEVGPRISLQLVKGEEGVMGGAVLFHRYLSRTPTEQEVLEERARQRRKLKERNEKLDSMAKTHNAKLKEKRKQKEAAAKAQFGDDEPAEELDPDAGEEPSAPPGKKRKFHPFAFGSKATGAQPGEKTVEMDSRPSKQKNRRGGQKQRDSADGKKGAGKGKGGGKGGKGDGKGKRSGSQKVLDRFHKKKP